MSNAVSEDNNSDTTGISDTEGINPDSRSIELETKEDVIVPEIVEKETETTLVPVSDIAETNTKSKKKSTLSKVGKSLASIITSI